MSLISDVRDIVARSRGEKHRLRAVNSSVLDCLETEYGALPAVVKGFAMEVGCAELFLERGPYPNYNIAICYKLEMRCIRTDEYYLNVGSTLSGATVFMRWDLSTKQYLQGVYGVKGAGIGKIFDSLEEWFAVSIKRVSKKYPKDIWNLEFGMKGFVPSG